MLTKNKINLAKKTSSPSKVSNSPFRCCPNPSHIHGGLSNYTGIGCAYIEIEPRSIALELPFLVRSDSFFCLSCPKLSQKGSVFHYALAPISKRGSFRRLSVKFNYSSKYYTSQHVVFALYAKCHACTIRQRCN